MTDNLDLYDNIGDEEFKAEEGDDDAGSGKEDGPDASGDGSVSNSTQQEQQKLMTNRQTANGQQHQQHQYGRKVALYVGNLTWWTTDEDVANSLRAIGVNDIVEIKFHENRQNGQSKGFCVVVVGSEQSSRLTLDKLPKREMHGQQPIVTNCNKQALAYFEQQAGGGRPESSGQQPQQQVPPPQALSRDYRTQRHQQPQQRPQPLMSMQTPISMQQQRPQQQQPQQSSQTQQQQHPQQHRQQQHQQQSQHLHQQQPNQPMPPHAGQPHFPPARPGMPPQQQQPMMMMMRPPQQMHMMPQQQQQQQQPGMPRQPMPMPMSAPHINPAFFGRPGHPMMPPQPQFDMYGRPLAPYPQMPLQPGQQPQQPGQQPQQPGQQPQQPGQQPQQQGQQPQQQGQQPQQQGQPQQQPQGVPAPAVSGGLSESDVEEILARNKTVSSSAISRAVQDAAVGDYAAAIETLVTAISLIKQSKLANDDRCVILINSLQDTLHGIESKSYGSRGSRSSRRRRSYSRSGSDDEVDERRRSRSRSRGDGRRRRSRDRHDRHDYEGSRRHSDRSHRH